MSLQMLMALFDETSVGFNLTMADGQDLDESSPNGVTVTANFLCNSDGSFNDGAGDSSTPNMATLIWSDDPAEDGTGFHVRFTYTSGTNQYSSGAGLNTWLALTSNRQWNFTKVPNGGSGEETTHGVYLIEFSDDGGSTVLDSATIDDISLKEETV